MADEEEITIRVFPNITVRGKDIKGTALEKELPASPGKTRVVHNGHIFEGTKIEEEE